MDTVDPAIRSRMMSKIRGKNTKPELVVRKFLHSRGFRYRLHRSDLPGKPDLVLNSLRVCIFVHGCFWHRHANCPYATTPKTRTEFWNDKFQKNVVRDLGNVKALESYGWHVYIIWECQLTKDSLALDKLLEKLKSIRNLQSDTNSANSAPLEAVNPRD